jgi:hypothetical protein
LQGTAFLRGEARGGNPTTFADGSAARSGFVAGGAVAAAAGTLRIASNSYHTNLAVAANVITNSLGAGFAYGGALFVESNVAAVVVRSVFTGNRAVAGSAPVSANTAEALGGGIYSGGSLLVTETTLDGNLARGGASSPAGAASGGALAAFGILSVTNSTFHQNVAEGGAWTGTGTNGSPGGAAWGGALFVVRSNLSVLNSTFAFNHVLSGPETNGVLPNGALPGDRGSVQLDHARQFDHCIQLRRFRGARRDQRRSGGRRRHSLRVARRGRGARGGGGSLTRQHQSRA